MFSVDAVPLQHITAAFSSVGRDKMVDVELDRQEVTQTLKRMFHNVSHVGPDRVAEEAPEKMCRLLFDLYDQ